MSSFEQDGIVTRIPQSDSACIQVTKRRAEYESHQATEAALVNLGKQMAAAENATITRRLDYDTIQQFTKELDGFDPDKFIATVMDSKRDIQYATLKSTTKYMWALQKLHQLQTEDKQEMKLTIKGLNDDKEDLNETIDRYIEESDTMEITIETLKVKNRMLRDEVDEISHSNMKLRSENKVYKAFANFVFIVSVVSGIYMTTL